MNIKTLIPAALVTLLAACASTEKTAQLALPENLLTMSPNTPLACQYQRTFSDGKAVKSSNWYFWRSPQRTETRDEASDQGEIWERDPAGRLFHTRLFYGEKVALEFMPGDLASFGSNINWQQLSALINPKNLGKELLLTNKETINGMLVEHYTGKLDGIPTSVDWLPNLQLAARIDKTLADGTSQMAIFTCGGSQNLAVKPITRTELEDFRRIDFTDLGDMESDPVVQRIEALMGGHQHAGH